MKKRTKIVLVGKYVDLHDAYISIAEALKHAGYSNDTAVEIKWINSEYLTEEKADEILEQMQKDMLERARAHRDAHTSVATNMAELEDILNNRPGFVKAMWCGDQACEDQIKEKFAATSRCMPFRQEHLSHTCVCCGKPAKKMVYWARAY